MDADGGIDFASLTTLVEWQIAAKVAGLCVVGSTGEAATLSRNEKIQIIEHVIAIAQGRVKIIVGSGSAATAETVDFINELNQIAGIDYIMCLTPYYVKPSQEGLYLHFQAVAKAARVPVILYNVPGRTACNLQDKTVIRLANDCPNIYGLKDATGDIKRCTNVLAQIRPQFKLYSGDDETALAFMLAGGHGVISVVSNLLPELMVGLTQAALTGNRQQAGEYNQRLLPFYQMLFIEANPIPVKWALFACGRLLTPVLRLPLTTLHESYQSKLQALIVENL
jgi:4-hydroxy-tetrahydrodipicolinate synthase